MQIGAGSGVVDTLVGVLATAFVFAAVDATAGIYALANAYDTRSLSSTSTSNRRDTGVLATDATILVDQAFGEVAFLPFAVAAVTADLAIRTTVIRLTTCSFFALADQIADLARLAICVIFTARIWICPHAKAVTADALAVRGIASAPRTIDILAASKRERVWMIARLVAIDLCEEQPTKQSELQ